MSSECAFFHNDMGVRHLLGSESDQVLSFLLKLKSIMKSINYNMEKIVTWKYYDEIKT